VTTLLLIRHATNDYVDKKLAGRLPGVHLNQAGRSQAEKLADQLKFQPIRAIYSSPLERAVETAAPLAAQLNLEIIIEDNLIEVDFGDWTGLDSKELNQNQEWERFKYFRSFVRPPHGELFSELQQRIVSTLEKITLTHPNQLVTVVAHADHIRAALAYYLGFSADSMFRLEISPASISIVKMEAGLPKICCVNQIALELHLGADL
jgi:broad specificity phosphatase PhoE